MGKIPDVVEKSLQEKIFPDLERGRKGFDLPHTKAVVYWMKYLLDNLGSIAVDPLVLITSAYAHDWGYIDLFEGVTYRSIEEINKRKPLHMQRGAEMIENFLREKLNRYFTEEQINRTAHLVSVHDLVEQVQTDDEVLIMEADTLGMLDADQVKPTFNATDNEIFLKEQILERRFPRFIHEAAIAVSGELFAKRRDYYRSLARTSAAHSAGRP